MAGGMAAQGMIPVFAVYSTFLQRGYDMLIHDISLEGLHAVFCVDRAGLVGSDGETHQGLFDVAMLSSVPGMTILAPSSFGELASMLRRGVEELSGPVAIRYPRGGENGYSEDHSHTDAYVLRAGSDLTLVAYGTMIGEALSAAEKLEKIGISAEIVKLNQICPIQGEAVFRSLRKTGRLLVAEEVARQGCVGMNLLAMAQEEGIPLKAAKLLNLESGIVQQGTVSQLRAYCGIDSEGIFQQAKEVCGIE
jgi:1-deoxy-D-xylulose-5-phosphate synthase